MNIDENVRTAWLPARSPTFSGIIALNYGWSSFVIGRRRGLDVEDNQGATRRPMDPANCPLTKDVSEALSRYGSDEHYDRLLSQLLAGIAADTRA